MIKKAIAIFLLIISVCLLAYGIHSREKSTKQITGRSTIGTSNVAFRIVSGCNIYLHEGWNLISICQNMTNKTVISALKDIDGQYRYVMEWNENRQAFDIFSPLSVTNPFNELAENKSYFIYLIPINRTINAGGIDFGDMEIPLIYGWNTPIYPYEFETEITRYLDSINNSYRYVMIWNASSQRFLIFSPLAAENEFYNISGGEGQFIYVSNTSGVILKYNKSALV